HDRYFLERVCDSVWALLGDGQISMLPRGVDEYLERMASRRELPPKDGRAGASSPQNVAEQAPATRPVAGSAGERAARKTLARIDKQLERLSERERTLDAEIATHAHDHVRLTELSAEYAVVRAEREGLEQEWFEAAELLE
ncbi:MAG: ABC transporter ATP-binding protein, partial [Nocardioides sp.]